MSNIVGTARANVLRGTGNADRIFGLGGDDDIAGRGGNDLLVGGSGADVLYGGPGADTLVGGPGDERLVGGAGIDTVQVEGTRAADEWLVGTGLAFDDPSTYIFEGTDGSSRVALEGVEHLVFNGQAGADRLVVEAVFGPRSVNLIPDVPTLITGIDSLTFNGGSGDDELDGSLANGPLLGQGGAGDDGLTGGSGNDTLLGGAGADTLDGGAGDDLLIGGLGPDRLAGGDGADVFRFLATDDPIPPNARVLPETITDFSQADGDRIDLRAIDADATRPGNQAFWFADGVQFIAAQPGLVTTERQADITVVRADTGAAVLTLVVQGRVEFAAADFVL